MPRTTDMINSIEGKGYTIMYYARQIDDRLGITKIAAEKSGRTIQASSITALYNKIKRKRL